MKNLFFVFLLAFSIMSFATTNEIETSLTTFNANEVENVAEEFDTCCYTDVYIFSNAVIVIETCVESASCLDTVVIGG